MNFLSCTITKSKILSFAYCCVIFGERSLDAKAATKVVETLNCGVKVALQTTKKWSKDFNEGNVIN